MMATVTPAPRTVTYFAISLFSSRTFWVNAAAFLVAASSLTEVTSVVPPRFVPMLGALVALANVYLRLHTVRPAVLIPPGTTQPVEVQKIGPPPPKAVTD